MLRSVKFEKLKSCFSRKRPKCARTPFMITLPLTCIISNLPADLKKMLLFLVPPLMRDNWHGEQFIITVIK